MEDEIDLAQYVKTIFKHWKLVAGITLAAVVTAGIVSFTAPPVYEAKILLQSTEASPKRMGDLAKSSETAKFMLQALSENLTPAERHLTSVSQMFKIDTTDTFISCSVRSGDARRAALLANAWAGAFTKYATEVSLKSLMSQSDLQAQIESTYTFYQQAQSTYESFQRTSNITEINHQIADANLLYQALQLQESLKNNQDLSGADQASSLAYLLIKLRSYTDIPQGTQISAGAAPAPTRADIDNLVRELEDRSGIHGKTSGEVLNEINTLSSRLEQESQRNRELAGSRDTAWNAYLTAIKNAETLNMQRSSMTAPVRVIDDATPPQDPVPSNRLTNIGIALALGLMLGMIAAFVAEYIEKRRPARPAAKPKS